MGCQFAANANLSDYPRAHHHVMQSQVQQESSKLNIFHEYKRHKHLSVPEMAGSIYLTPIYIELLLLLLDGARCF